MDSVETVQTPLTEAALVHAGPTRAVLWAWLLVCAPVLGVIVSLLLTHGLPGGPAAAEFMAVTMFGLVWAMARSVSRLIRRDHP